MTWEICLFLTSLGIGCAALFARYSVLHQSKSTWPICVAFFSWGLSAGLLFTLLTKFKFSYEVSLAHILNLCFTIAVAFFFQYLLKQKTDTRKCEKDLISLQLKAVSENLTAVRKAFLECYEAKKIEATKGNSLTIQLRNLANSIVLVQKLLKLAVIKHDSESMELLKKDYLRYKKLLTGKPFPSKPFAAKHLSSQERIFETLNERIILLSLHVTSAS